MYIITAEKTYKKETLYKPSLCLYKGAVCDDNYFGIFCKIDAAKSRDIIIEEKPKIFRSKASAEKIANTMLLDEEVIRRIYNSALIVNISNAKVWNLEEYLKVAAMSKLKGDGVYPLWYIK